MELEKEQQISFHPYFGWNLTEHLLLLQLRIYRRKWTSDLFVCMFFFLLILCIIILVTFVESLSAAADSEDHVTVWVIFFLFI